MEKGKIPTLIEVEEIIKEIETEIGGLILNEINNQNLHKKISQFIFTKFGLSLLFNKPYDSNALNQPLYRVRKDTGFDNTMIHEFSYTPVAYTLNYNRANIPKHPVFYCAPSITTALIETIKGKIIDDVTVETYYISEWFFSPNKTLNITSLFVGDLERDNLHSQLNVEFKNNIKESFPYLSLQEVESINEIVKYFGSKFVKDNSYRVSSSIAHQYLYNEDLLKRSDALIYPSVQADYYRSNFAVNPNTVLAKMYLNKVYKVQLKSFDNTFPMLNFEYGLAEIAYNNDGYLVWQKPTNAIASELSRLIDDKVI